MIQFLKKIILIFLFCLGLTNVFAQVKFTASSSPSRINRDEYFTLRFVLENASDVKQINPPSFKKFNLVSGPNQESGMSNVNGVVTQYVAVSYILQAKQPGEYSFDGATAFIGKTAIKSNPTRVFVKKTSSGSSSNLSSNISPFADPFGQQQSAPDFKDYILKKGDNVAEKVSKNMQLQLQTDKKTCYVGEPVVATYKLYSRLKSESSLSKNPSFNGFSVIDLSQSESGNYRREMLNGKEYNVYVIRKAQLYPLQSGDIELETAVLDNTVQFIKDNGTNGPNSVNDLLNGFAVGSDDVETQNVSLSSKPVTISVKPLPEAGKPENFKGAVGSFAIDAMPGKTSFTTDEAGTLAIRISGSGNLQLLTAPEINWPKELESFDPKITDNSVTTTVPVSGNKIFLYSFTAEQAGTYTLPAISFSYFDPSGNSYKTLETPALKFTVLKGTGRSSYSKELNATRPEPSFLNNLLDRRPWVIGIVAILILSLLFFWLKRENRLADAKTLKAEKEGAEREILIQAIAAAAIINQKNPLEESEGCLYSEDCMEFYAVLNREMKEFISRKFSLDSPVVNYKTLSLRLDKAHVPNNLVLEMQSFFQEIEFQLYTPIVQDDKRSFLYSRAHELIQEINNLDTNASYPGLKSSFN